VIHRESDPELLVEVCQQCLDLVHRRKRHPRRDKISWIIERRIDLLRVPILFSSDIV
jgi:hypothetical protein